MKLSSSTPTLLCSLLLAASCVPEADPPGADAGPADDDMIATHEGEVGRLRVHTPEGTRIITYMVEGGHAIHEGDIDLGPIEDIQHLRGGAANLGARWPSSTVYYRFGIAFSGQVCNGGNTG